jgi:hypothetical protein
MSTRIIRLNRLYNILKESIDFENAQSLPIKTNTETRFDIEGLNVGIRIEQFPKEGKVYFPSNTILYKNFNPKTYYNLGFDVQDSTSQLIKTDYKTLSKILGIIVKSTLNWIKQNKPEVLTIMPDASSDREFEKKLSIYASILNNNESLLNSIGYSWDKGRIFDGKLGLFIKKKPLK